jgi:hypothetical protein
VSKALFALITYKKKGKNTTQYILKRKGASFLFLGGGEGTHPFAFIFITITLGRYSKLGTCSWVVQAQPHLNAIKWKFQPW